MKNNQLNIIWGNIVDDKILQNKDAIVNPTNPKMRYGMGVSEAIFRKAGIAALEDYCENTFNVGYSSKQCENDMKPTEVRVTPGFGVNCDIIFAQGPNNIYFDIKNDDMNSLLFKTYDNILETIIIRGYKNIVFPSLGTGHYGFSHKDVAKGILISIVNFLNLNPDISITIVLFEKEVCEYYKSTLLELDGQY